MWCPECGAGYVEGIFGCPDCRVALVPEPRPRPEYVKHVTVLKTGNPILVALVKSIFSSAGIRHYVKGEVLQGLFGVGTAEIEVGAEDEQEARTLLTELDIEHGNGG